MICCRMQIVASTWTGEREHKTKGIRFIFNITKNIKKYDTFDPEREALRLREKSKIQYIIMCRVVCARIDHTIYEVERGGINPIITNNSNTQSFISQHHSHSQWVSLMFTHYKQYQVSVFTLNHFIDYTSNSVISYFPLHQIRNEFLPLHCN